MTRYDAVVIGAGQAGPSVAFSQAAQGRRVAIVEMAEPGGTCLNHGCRPTKALRASAVVAHSARRAADFGVHVGEVRVDFGQAIGRVHTLIDGMRAGLQQAIDEAENLDYVHGRARLVGDPTGAEHRVVVTADDGSEQELTTSEVYLNVGNRASIPPIDGLEHVPYLTEVELLALSELPEHLIIVGGGYIGLEFGQMFRRFGSEVTIVAGGGIAAREDPDVQQILTDLFTDEGVRIVEGRPSRVSGDTSGVSVEVPEVGTITGSHLLIATGRRSNSDQLGPDTGLETDAHGFVLTDDRFATNVPGVWALGDVNGRGAFTHTSYQDGDIYLHPPRTVAGRVTTYAMFTDPPLGRVGMGLQEARESGRRVLKAEIPMASVSRAKLESETTGVMRVLVDADTEEFLGATILGLQADDVVQVIGVAMQAGVRYPIVRDALPIHPTVSEFFPTILAALTPLD
ncbi:mercuric reductase [Microlunatus flavus]|uniref:Pyruvate/2-oxoglutarate dehydrogenase complex, dihydrolipoamide dehydrogenase (E3) component n=1 Tax=Microlunatus flavus TaxID=1036181 RepID=A0A1H9LBM5_9ACTN|nr:mercuric reductase [Microlunatus flavus]SER08760.1 Pyruvate/2-oxoglutarate dehydrogenase complex, dihydrolipoamide dehydrogenase (E3) component [Microlunatus flavus]